MIFIANPNFKYIVYVRVYGGSFVIQYHMLLKFIQNWNTVKSFGNNFFDNRKNEK